MVNKPVMSDFVIGSEMLGDAPFELATPKSNSKGIITFVSSNPDVASVFSSLHKRLSQVEVGINIFNDLVY